ncbi:MAG TPA: SagB/ThcOx family dehydrogenase [Syntrophales bacterium]|mgnify:FL=1|nr:SagB/ThcOx family dehydrogenase [Syntrophales bacterium]HOX93907.1 SagB/ThcOx family dehydrogenase [Syntrophales bacterium]HPI57984.1 SagB/ThcOx family dehydrogenase [Syntrophales bacterium]HPN25888.1 SagB/ThcOx family dehydrogenase [Syntrophales bacterium]HQM29556.1 SagB/ThcOx family dehydrogenase [Syntrophales bacterium]
MDRERLETYRFFLKDSIRKRIDFAQTDQSRGADPPPIEKPFSADARRVDLVKPGKWASIPACDLAGAIGNRRSRRTYRREPLTIEELSFLLWATQGVRQRIDAGHAYRTVPSAGCRHALETYLCVLNIEGLEPAVYRYLPLEHQLLFEFAEDHLAQKMVAATFGQPCPGQAAVTFIWTTIPYRMEWRYDLAAHKVIAIDAGHVCQNLYLACEVIGAGTCAIAAYDQEALDTLLRIDGREEFAVYLAPVGRTKKPGR